MWTVIIYFASFGVEYTAKDNHIKNIITNIYTIQAHDLIRCGYFCIECIEFMLERLLNCANSFCPNDFGKNDKKVLQYFQWLKR